MTTRILEGDALAVLKTLPPESVHCCVTSPPYWGLRDYGTARWDGGDPACNHKQGRPGAGRADGIIDDRAQRNRDGTGAMGGDCRRCGAVRIDSQLGLEATPGEFIEKMTAVFREVRRVLRSDGTCWVNMGDSYNTGTSSSSKESADVKHGQWANSVHLGRRRANVSGLKVKDLCGIPWRLAFALQDDGWWLRQDIIWAKPNPMPESVTDRCTKSHEYVFLLTKSERYYYDHEAIKEPVTQSTIARLSQDVEGQAGSDRVPGKTNGRMKAVGKGGKNAFRGQGHFREGATGPANREGCDMQDVGAGDTRNKRSVWTVATQPYAEAHFATYPPKLIEPCILAGCPKGGVVLDPFFGSGTTGLVADRLGRDCIGIELNPAYAVIARNRINDDAPLFAKITA